MLKQLNELHLPCISRKHKIVINRNFGNKIILFLSTVWISIITKGCYNHWVASISQLYHYFWHLIFSGYSWRRDISQRINIIFPSSILQTHSQVDMCLEYETREMRYYLVIIYSQLASRLTRSSWETSPSMFCTGRFNGFKRWDIVKILVARICPLPYILPPQKRQLH